jgi:hypothetical protein
MSAITVTMQHIEDGMARCASHCPVALALIDAFPEAVGIFVNADHLKIWPRWSVEPAYLEMSPEVQNFVFAFDNGEPVEPFAFTLDYPAVTP